MNAENISTLGGIELSEQELDAVSGAANSGFLADLNQYVSNALGEFLKVSSMPSFPPPHCSSIANQDEPIVDDFTQPITIA